MAEFDLNLSTQPFRGYRLINIVLAAILILLAVVSVRQALGFIQYSNMARSIRVQEQENRVNADMLGKRVGELESRLDRPESTAKLNEIGFLNHLILRKNLSWTKLFRILEEMVPPNVHLTNLTPEIGLDGSVGLKMGVRSRSIADVTEFIERLEQSKLFENVQVFVEEKRDAIATTDVDLTLSTTYFPQRDTR